MSTEYPSRQQSEQCCQQSQSKHPLTSEEIIAQYPEAQAVLEANQNQTYKSMDDVVHQNFSLESRKKTVIFGAALMPAVAFIAMLVLFAMEGELDGIVFLMIVGIVFIMAIAGCATAFSVRQQLDKKIEERNAKIALAAAKGEDVAQYMPGRFEDLADQYQHPFDFSIYRHVDQKQVESDISEAKQAMRANTSPSDEPRQR